MGSIMRAGLAGGLLHVYSHICLVASALALPPGFAVETVIGGADFPTAMAFTPDGSRLFYNERSTGNIRIYELAAQQLLPTPFATVEVQQEGERGLLGIALDPQFDTNHFVYVFHTVTSSLSRITRLTDVGNIGMDPTIIVDQIPAALFHNGGYIGFGPDGKLYVTIGENGVGANAQDLTIVPGKVHRFNPDGTIPADNPFPGSSIWSFGLRNSFGFSFHPVTRSLFLSEPGPTADDEINRIVKGDNYGWPNTLGCAGDARFTDPLLALTPVVTPTGILVFGSNRYPEEFLHTLFFGEFNTGRIRQSVIAGDPDTRSEPPTAFLDLGGGFDLNGILDLKMGPDGNIWFSTTNSIRQIVYTLSLTLPALATSGTPAIGNRIIVSLLGNPGETGHVELSLAGRVLRKRVGVIPPLGVVSGVVRIPNDATLVGSTLGVRGGTVDSSSQASLAAPLELVILGSDPSPGCVATE